MSSSTGGTGHSTRADRRPLLADRFLGAAVVGMKRQPKSGFGARRPSTAEHDRPLSV
jgi:hypothetical protein